MAVIIGEIRQIQETDPLFAKPGKWLASRVVALFRSRRNPSPFPDRIWRRHSALLDAARKNRTHRFGTGA